MLASYGCEFGGERTVVRTWAARPTGLSAIGETVVASGEAVGRARLSPGGDLLVVTTGDDLSLVNVAKSEVVGRLEKDDDIADDVSDLTAASPLPRRRRQIHSEEEEVFSSCDVDCSGRLVCASHKKGVLMWDCKTRRILRSFESVTPKTVCCFEATGACVASGGSDGVVELFAVKAKKLIAKLDYSGNTSVKGLEFSPTRPHVCVSVHSDGHARVWDAARAQLVADLVSKGGSKTCRGGLSFSPVNQKFFATCDGAVSFWDMDAKKAVKILEHERAQAIAFVTERTIALGTDHGHILLYDLRNASRPVDAVRDGAHQGPVASLHFVDNTFDLLPAAHNTKNSPIRPTTRKMALTEKSLKKEVDLSSDKNNVVPVADLTPQKAIPKVPAATPPVKHEPPPPPPPIQEEKHFFDKDMMRDVIESCVRSATQDLCRDVENLHVDLIRQFQVQQQEISALLEDHASRLADVVAANAALRAENERLRHQTTKPNNGLTLLPRRGGGPPTTHDDP